MGSVIMLGRETRVTYPSVSSTFANNTWEDIIAACQKKQVPESWTVGNQKSITIGGTEYLVDIIGKNHDYYADNSGLAPLTFQLHDCHKNTAWIKNEAASGNWESSDMRATYIPDIKNQMPAAVKAALRKVNKLTSNGTVLIDPVEDDLFLLSEVEVYGTAANSFSGEGEQYGFYKAGGSKIKNLNGSPHIWWLRSPYNWGSKDFVAVQADGTQNIFRVNNWYGVAPAFCF